MQYRETRGWRISVIGLGCYALSGAYGPVDVEAFAGTIRAAYEAGVNFFDTAESYGAAEEFLGQILAPFRDEVYIATKLPAGSGQPDLSDRAIREACDDSLQRLGTDLIDLYQVHFDDPRTPVLETVTALEGLVQAGKIRRFGVGHLPADRVEDYAQASELFSVLMELSPVARAASRSHLPVCIKHDLAAIAFSVTGRGILTGRYGSQHPFSEGDIRRMDPLFQRERYESAVRVRAYLGELGRAYGCSSVQMGIAWVLAQPQVACALTGTSSPEHLAENLAAAEIELDETDLADLNRFLDDEEARLTALQGETIRQLLSDPLSADPEMAFNDLLYVLETAVTLGGVSESDIMPAFQELFTLRKSLDADARRKMHAIQQVLRQMILRDSP